MHSFSTVYHCTACNESFDVEVTDLGDPREHISEKSQAIMRRSRALQNQLGQTKPGDPVEDLARELLEQEARSELRYATCPACHVENPEGIEADRAERRQTRLFGLVPFGIIAAVAWFYPWAALILPGMDLLVFRPMMVVQARKSDKPFPFVPFALGIVLDAALIAMILLYPRTAPLVPLAGIVQWAVRHSTKPGWKWEEARKKIRFEQPEKASS